MTLGKLARALPAGIAAVVVTMGIAAPSQAIVSAGTAYIIESNGYYTLVNNTLFYADAFIVTNPAAGHGATSSTTQFGWSSFTCFAGTCFGNDSFKYYDSSTAADIGPGASSSAFFFNASPASQYEIDLRDRNGAHPTKIFGTAIPGAVPEPATWALMLAGFGAAGTALRRRRSSLGSVAA